MFASIGERSKQNDTIFLLLLLLLVLFIAPSSSEDASNKTSDGSIKTAGNTLWRQIFPQIQVTIYNELDNKVLYLCGMSENFESGLRELQAKKQQTFLLSQYAFPLRWCYLYIDESKNGFFWAYAVRQRCSKCFWRIADHLYLYRSDRNRWERQSLYSPLTKIKNSTDIKTKV